MLSEKYMLQNNICCAIILPQSYKYNWFDIVEFGDYLWKLIHSIYTYIIYIFLIFSNFIKLIYKLFYILKKEMSF